MRTRKSVLLNKDNPICYIPVSNNQSFHIVDLVNNHKYLVEASVIGNPQAPPKCFSLIDKCIYGLNTEMHNALELKVQPFRRDDDFVSLDIVIY